MSDNPSHTDPNGPSTSAIMNWLSGTDNSYGEDGDIDKETSDQTRQSRSRAPSPPTPITQAPILQAPVAQAPVAQAPYSQAPVAQAPVAQAPIAQAPIAQAPIAQAPIVQAPVIQATAQATPPTSAHSTEISSTDPSIVYDSGSAVWRQLHAQNQMDPSMHARALIEEAEMSEDDMNLVVANQGLAGVSGANQGVTNLSGGTAQVNTNVNVATNQGVTNLSSSANQGGMNLNVASQSITNVNNGTTGNFNVTNRGSNAVHGGVSLNVANQHITNPNNGSTGNLDVTNLTTANQGVTNLSSSFDQGGVSLNVSNQNITNPNNGTEGNLNDTNRTTANLGVTNPNTATSQGITYQFGSNHNHNLRSTANVNATNDIFNFTVTYGTSPSGTNLNTTTNTYTPGMGPEIGDEITKKVENVDAAAKGDEKITSAENTADNATTQHNFPATQYDGLISKDNERLATIQRQALVLAVARGAPAKYIKEKMELKMEEAEAWGKWEVKKEKYDFLKTLEKKKKRVRGKKVAPPTPGEELGGGVTLVGMGGENYNANPGQWAMDTMADNKVLEAGGAKGVGTLVREQKEKDEAAFRARVGVLAHGAQMKVEDELTVEMAAEVLMSMKGE